MDPINIVSWVFFFVNLTTTNLSNRQLGYKCKQHLVCHLMVSKVSKIYGLSVHDFSKDKVINFGEWVKDKDEEVIQLHG